LTPYHRLHKIKVADHQICLIELRQHLHIATDVMSDISLVNAVY